MTTPPDRDSLAEAVADVAAKRDVGGAVAKLATRLTAVGSRFVCGEVGTVADGLLDSDVTDIVAHGWERHREIVEAKEWTRVNPGGEKLVPLATHTVTSTCAPHVDVFVEGTLVTRIDLGVRLVTRFEGAVVAIRRGEVAEVRSGRVEVKGTVSCESVTIAERSRTFDLPGVLGFRASAPMPAPASAHGATPSSAIPRYPIGSVVNGHRFTGTTWEPVTGYRPGDIVNGYRLDPSGRTWEPVPAANA
ncbi:hypothetical protein [Agromyces sp. ZXT2-6]|uniref:hypothetical protein n=1 Tax=Agromyces sp. ZXT2-6 TaxID=3461153 RepID=UPI004054DFEB